MNFEGRAVTVATVRERSDWRIVMAPSKRGLWIVLPLVWAFAGGAYALWRFAEGEVSAFGHLLIFSFPVLISYYGLRGLVGENGKLVLVRHGFTLTLPSGATHFFYWDRVEKFGTHVFGDPVVTQTGVATARFAYVDEDRKHKTVGLANNLPYAGEDFARIMEYARLEAANGWPKPLTDLTSLAVAALGSHGETSLPERLKAQPTESGHI